MRPNKVDRVVQNKCNFTIINSNDEEIAVNCEAPSNQEERAQGLMYRDELGENDGMFYDSINGGFWMKDVEIPLEMIFINGDEISEILPANPLDTDNISISVAEGNVNNLSIIMKRPINSKIRGLIRLPDSWAYNHKTDKSFTVKSPEILKSILES